MDTAVPRTPALVRELMQEYGALTRDALLAFLPDREPRRYLYEPMADYPRRSARYLRPAICIASARAHGAPTESAIHCAVSIELLHNALLVVDDIEDGSDERRGAPTLHRKHGIPVALNAGSTLSILSLVPLLGNVERCGPNIALWIFERAIEVAQRCAEGQALELGWRLDNRVDLTDADYLAMVLRKTCSYSTMFPMRVGAMIGLRRPEVSPSLVRFAYLVGLAFQIQDDLLNVVGDHARYGKELGGDLLEGKRTLLVIRLLERCSVDDRRFVVDFLGKQREHKTPDEVGRVEALLAEHHCVDDVRRFAQGLVGAAMHEFSRAFEQLAPSRDKDFLEGLATWVIEQV
jgi:geranylgeranyl diphosphate synthase, type II